MKKSITIITGVLTLAAATVCAMDAKPVLHYDFTSGKIQVEGKYAPPKNHGDFSVSSPQKACFFPGEISFMTVPESMDISAERAITLYALVKFSEPEKNRSRDLDMIFFKDRDFLMGRDKERLSPRFALPCILMAIKSKVKFFPLFHIDR